MKRITLLIIIIILIILIMFLVALRNSIDLNEASSSDEGVSNELTEEVNKEKESNNVKVKTVSKSKHNNSKVGYLYGEEINNYDSMHNGILPICKDNLWALINKEGKLLTDFKYKLLEVISYVPGEPIIGLIDDPEKPFNDMWCLIDQDGKEVTDSIIKNKLIFPGSDGYYIILNGNAKKVIISKSGEIISDEFDDIIYDYYGGSHVYALQKDSTVMVIDESFNTISQFDVGQNDLKEIKDNRLIFNGSNYLEKVIYDFNGNIDNDYVYNDRIGEIGTNMANSATKITLFPLCENIETLSEEKINSLGLEEYDVIEYVADGRYVIFIGGEENSENRTFGVFDITKNEVIINCEYKAIRYLGNGVFLIAKDSKMGIIDENQKEIIPLSEEIVDCTLMANDVIAVKKNNSWNIYNSKGEKLLEDSLDYDKVGEYNEDGYAPVVSYKGDMFNAICGFIDKDFNLAIGNFENAKLPEQATNE